MGKRGPKPKRKNVVWSSKLAYAVGLLVTDGSLSKDGRHIDLTSKDLEQLENFKDCLSIDTRISYKTSGSGVVYPRLQFSDVGLYRFLVDVGMTPAKTKTLSSIKIPDKYFADFLRGHHDGDGSFFSYWDKRWRSSFMFYLAFISASAAHAQWLNQKIADLVGVTCSISEQDGLFRLRYAKAKSLKILRYMYWSSDVICLSRKRLKIERALSTIGLSL